MAICDIAGLKVDIKNIKGRTEKQAVPYYSASQSENQKADITINVTPERIKAAMAEHPGRQRHRQINAHAALAEAFRRSRSHSK